MISEINVKCGLGNNKVFNYRKELKEAYSNEELRYKRKKIDFMTLIDKFMRLFI